MNLEKEENWSVEEEFVLLLSPCRSRAWICSLQWCERSNEKQSWERENCAIPPSSQILGKKLSHIPAIPLTVPAVCFPFISVIITHTGVVEFTAVWAVAVPHEAAGRQCCQHPSVFLFPGCSFPVLDAQTLPIAPCFAVSVVCIALRFRCGTVILSHTLNEEAVLPGHFHPLREAS